MKLNSTTRTITHNGNTLSYDLHRKKVKNINLRIHTDGTVTVSASSAVPLTYIDSFIKSKAEYILSAQAHYRETQKLSPTKREFINGETFYLLGKPLLLSLSQGSVDTVQVEGTYLQVTTKDITDTKRIEALIHSFLSKQCESVFHQISDDIAPLFQSYGIAPPHIRMRTMRTQWGSCLPTKGIITLNKKLIEAPMPSIEYVVLHEYCHFIHPNHSKDFYHLVAQLMPDWSVRREVLKKWA